MMEIILNDALIPGGHNSVFAETFRFKWSAGYECRTLDGDFKLVTEACLTEWMKTGREKDGNNYLFRVV